MSSPAFPLASAIVAALLLTTVSGTAGKGDSPQIRDQEKIVHALSRLTLGARPGDEGRVKAIGLKKWIDLQLHPERIQENPVLAAKLQPLDTLAMTPAQMMASYPSPQQVKDMAAGRLPFPEDPDKRMMIRRLVAHFDNSKAPQEDSEPTMAGTPVEKLALLEGLPRERQDQLIESMGQGTRMQVYAIAAPELRRRIQSSAGPVRLVAEDLSDAKLYRAVYSERQLEEVLVDFWYNHFNVFFDKGMDRYLVTSYERDAIRPNVLRKFEDLLRATAQSPAMLFYLDNWQSAGADSIAGKGRNRGLNENYGRELLELHTLGVDGGYTQKDVTEVARCFTGWTIRQPRRAAEFEFNPRMHDYGPKTVLGATIPAGGGIEDGYKVLHLLAQHPATARFISRKLAMRFVSDEPPESLVDRMAKVFLKKDGDIPAVLAALFNSPEFWSQTAYRAKVKSPFDFVTSAIRAVDADVDFGFGLTNQLMKMGQPLYRKSEPTGYPETGREWANSAGLMARMNFAVALAANKIPGVRVTNPDRNVPPAGLTLGSPEFQKK
ncbi:MAG: DUF1800 domain-containing protein [Bryobacteraceae bacterium]